MTKAQKHAKIHEMALSQLSRAQTATYEQREQALGDRRFYSIAGAQWEGDLEAQFKNKPRFEINKIHLAIIKIFNEYRNNRVTVNFVSKDGNPNVKLADVCNGLYRADEQDSSAEEAYDNAFEEAVGGGFGAFRLTSKYEDEEDEDNVQQRICMEPIFDADSCVFFDIDAKLQDKSDAKYCFVMSSMTYEDFEDEFGFEAEVSTVPKEISRQEYDWYTPELVYIAEYYKMESVKETVHVYLNLAGEEEKYTDADFEDNPDLVIELEATGKREIRTKTVHRDKVHKYILSGSEVLEDCGIIPGKCIPIIPVFGKRWFVDGIERFMGHVRLAKDSQRLKNMLTSQLAEISSESTVSKPIFVPEQMAGHEGMWAADSIENFPYLIVNPTTDANGQTQNIGPIAYTQPPQVPPALATLMQLMDVDMKELLGGSGETEKMLSHVSGKAHELLQRRIDGQAFIYMDNFAKAVRRAGQVWLSMAKDLYVETGRKMKAIDPLGQSSQVELGQPGISEYGTMTEDNDLTKASFDVSVDVGPSSASQREATVTTIQGMMQFASGNPQDMQVLQALALMNIEGEGISQARDYFRKKLVEMGVLKPTEEEAKALAEKAKEPSAQDKALLGMAAESQANAQKTQAEIQKIASDIELNKAKTAETYSDVDRANLEAVDTLLRKKQEELQRQQEAVKRQLEAALAQEQLKQAQVGPQMPNA